MVTYKCTTCTKPFYHKSDYTKHLARKTPCSVILLNPINLKCIDCGKSYDTPYNFSQHRRRSGHNSIITEKSKPDIDNNENPLINSANDSKIIPTSTNAFLNTKLENSKSIDILLIQVLNQAHNQPAQLDNMNMDIEIDMDIDEKSSESFYCEYCDRKYDYKYNLNKHLKSCQAKPKIEQKDVVVKSLIEQMDKLNAKLDKIDDNHINNKSNTTNINNTAINTTNNNNNNNIKLCAFGEEDLSFISDSKLIDIMRKGYDGIKYMIECVHFNKNKPEYHNIYLQKLRTKHVNIFDGETWMIEDNKVAIEKLINNKLLFLKEKYEEIKDSLSNSTKSKFAKIIEFNQENVQWSNIITELQYILFNKKAMIILTKDKVYENTLNMLIC